MESCTARRAKAGHMRSHTGSRLYASIAAYATHCGGLTQSCGIAALFSRVNEITSLTANCREEAPPLTSWVGGTLYIGVRVDDQIPV